MSLWICVKCSAVHVFTPVMVCSKCGGPLEFATIDIADTESRTQWIFAQWDGLLARFAESKQ